MKIERVLFPPVSSWRTWRGLALLAQSIDLWAEGVALRVAGAVLDVAYRIVDRLAVEPSE